MLSYSIKVLETQGGRVTESQVPPTHTNGAVRLSCDRATGQHSIVFEVIRFCYLQSKSQICTKRFKRKKWATRDRGPMQASTSSSFSCPTMFLDCAFDHRIHSDQLHISFQPQRTESVAGVCKPESSKRPNRDRTISKEVAVRWRNL